jgi:hypothetical protein
MSNEFGLAEESEVEDFTDSITGGWFTTDPSQGKARAKPR